MVLCKYYDMVFVADRIQTKLVNKPYSIRFIDFFDGDNKEFVKTYKNKYPNHQISIYKDIRKPLKKSLRNDIIIFLKKGTLVDKIRNRNLEKLLNPNI